jgi:superfamily II DNA or RNA helicase
VPRIVLVQQNIDRLTKYGVPQEKIGAYFGERKEVREITISTYQSAISNLDLINNSNMIIFDEVHLVSDTATTLRKVFDFVMAGDPKKLLLGLTATIDEQDPRYNTILSLLPPVKRYMIKEAVKKKLLRIDSIVLASSLILIGFCMKHSFWIPGYDLLYFSKTYLMPI